MPNRYRTAYNTPGRSSEVRSVGGTTANVGKLALAPGGKKKRKKKNLIANQPVKVTQPGKVVK